MDLKQFKTGIETLARFTNQRLSEPDPFAVQVAKNDGRISLIAGNPHGTIVWRLDSFYKGDLGIRREGIPSKPLVQAAKALKGKGEIHVKVHGDSLEFFMSPQGGSIKLKYVDMPDLVKPPRPDEKVETTIQIADLEDFARKVQATDDEFNNVLWFDSAGQKSKTTTIQCDVMGKYVGYQAWMPSSDGLSAPVAVSARFWDALRARGINGDARILQTGVRVHFGEFEASTSFLEGQVQVRPAMDKYFAAGRAVDIAGKYDRKYMISNLKVYDKTTALTIEAEGKSFLSDGSNHMEIDIVSKKGWGRVEFNPKYLQNILNSLTSKEVVIGWQTDGRLMMITADRLSYREGFCLAPIVRA